MIVVLDPKPKFREKAVEALGQADTLQLARTTELEELLNEERGRVSTIVTGPNLGTDESLRLAEWIQTVAPEVGMILIQPVVSARVLQAALHAGVRDVLPVSFEGAALGAAVDRAESVASALRAGGSGPHPDAPERPGKIITVFSPKGGVGKSVVATNLAVLLAAGGESVVAIDLDLQFGDLAIMLQVFPPRTIYDVTSHAVELDAQTIMGYTAPHGSGVALLPAPLEPGLAENVPADRAQTILRTLRAAGKTVIVDTPPWFTDHVLAALDVSDEMVLVATMDVPSIKNIKVALQTLEVLGYQRSRLRLVLNRADSKVGLTSADIERALGTSIDVAIPSSRDVPLSVNRGRPIALADARSPVTASFSKLVAMINAGTPAQQPAGRPKLRFGRRVR